MYIYDISKKIGRIYTIKWLTTSYSTLFQVFQVFSRISLNFEIFSSIKIHFFSTFFTAFLVFLDAKNTLIGAHLHSTRQFLDHVTRTSPATEDYTGAKTKKHRQCTTKRLFQREIACFSPSRDATHGYFQVRKRSSQATHRRVNRSFRRNAQKNNRQRNAAQNARAFLARSQEFSKYFQKDADFFDFQNLKKFFHRTLGSISNSRNKRQETKHEQYQHITTT